MPDGNDYSKDAHPLDKDYGRGEGTPANVQEEVNSESPEMSSVVKSNYADYGDTPHEPSNATSKRLIKGSLAILVLGAFVALIAGVVSNVAVPQSIAERTASWINRVGIFAMLFAFVIMLIAFRLQQLGNVFKSIQFGKRNWRAFPILLVANVVGFGLFAFVVSAASNLFGSWAVFVGVALSSTVASLAATMAIHHRGSLRAYGVGVLVTFMLQLCGFTTILLFSGAIYTRNAALAGGNTPLLVLQALACFNGLVCAAYAEIVKPRTSAESSDGQVADFIDRTSSNSSSP